MKMLKKFISTILASCLLFSLCPAFRAEASYKPSFTVESKCAYLVNTDTGTVVYEKNADQKCYPASLTKIMTAIIAIEHVKDLNGTKVTAPQSIYDEFVGQGVSTADIRPGETLRMTDLLYALILPSACEAGSIIANYVGGDEGIPGFVDMMNAKAKELGAVNTHFSNAHGLYDPGEVTTAKDMYKIAKYAMSLPVFAKICNTPTYKMPSTNFHPGGWYIHHTVKLLFKGSPNYYPYAIGVKSGTLNEVGRNLVTTASKNGYNYMLVTLAAPLRDKKGQLLSENGSYTDAKNIYNWAFSSFAVKKIVKGGDVVSESKVRLSLQQDYITLLAKNDVTALLPVGADASIVQRNVTLMKNVRAPIRKGQTLGKMDLKISGEVVSSVDLVASDDISRNTGLYIMDLTGRFFQNVFFRIIFILLVIVLIGYWILSNRQKRRSRKRARRQRYSRR